MCVGIVLKDGRHLQSIAEIEKHLNVDLIKYAYPDQPIQKDSCTCQIKFDEFMNEPEQKDKFEYDYVEYYEL
jgi:hypothetical protein